MKDMNAKSSNLLRSEKLKSTSGQSPLLKTKLVKTSRLGLSLRYAEMGDKNNPTIILLHGVPENLQGWYAVAPILAEKYHVLAVDWPGFGGSDPFINSMDYTSRNYAQIVVDFMDALNIEKTNLVATDIALLPALLVGLEHANRVSKLVVMDGIPFPTQKHSSWELKSFAKKGSFRGKFMVRWFPAISAKIAYIKGFYRGYSIPKEIQQEFLSDGKTEPTKIAFLSYFQNFHIGQEYFEPRARNLKVPVQVIWGENDRFINPKLAYEIATTLPNTKLTIIKKSGHYVHMDTPREVAEIVTDFL